MSDTKAEVWEIYEFSNRPEWQPFQGIVSIHEAPNGDEAWAMEARFTAHAKEFEMDRFFIVKVNGHNARRPE